MPISFRKGIRMCKRRNLATRWTWFPLEGELRTTGGLLPEKELSSRRSYVTARTKSGPSYTLPVGPTTQINETLGLKWDEQEPGRVSVARTPQCRLVPTELSQHFIPSWYWAISPHISKQLEAEYFGRKRRKIPNSQITQRMTGKGLLDKMGETNDSPHMCNQKNKDLPSFLI